MPIALAAEDMCTDSDKGPETGRNPSDDVLKTKGSTKYGIQTKEDICVISETADVQTEESYFLKEYYCDDSDTRKSVTFDCRDYGFEKCKDGICEGQGSTSTEDRVIDKSVKDCGNKILEKDKGEECDPPGSVCLEGDNYGMCLDDCTCRWHNSQESAGTVDDETDIEDTTTSDENEKEDLKEDDVEDNEEDKEEIEEDNDEKTEDKYPIPEVNIPNAGEIKDFNEEPGIKVTKGVSGFFKKLWQWFIDLF